jgi:protein-disulfide isomerase
MVLVTGGATLLAAGIIVFALPKGAATDKEIRTPPVTYQPGLFADETLGSGDAPVVIELYSDFQCPACRLFVTTQLHRLVGEFVTNGTARIEARDIAILGRGARDESLELAVGARCAAEQDRYWQFHDLVFWNQGRENRGEHSEAFVGRIATAAGLDGTAFAACLGRADVRTAISDQTRTAIASGISSTPTLVVNGQPVVGVREYDQLAALIRELALGPSGPRSPGALPDAAVASPGATPS